MNTMKSITWTKTWILTRATGTALIGIFSVSLCCLKSVNAQFEQGVDVLEQHELSNKSRINLQGSGAHGGTAVVCIHRDGRRSVEVYDYFYGSDTLGKVPFLGNAPDYVGRAQFVLQRLSKLDSTAYDKYMQWLKEYARGEMKPTPRSEIPKINDMREMITPRRKDDPRIVTDPNKICVDRYKVQFAVQLKNPRDQEKRYLVDESLLLDADLNQQGGLALHEIFLRDAINGYPVPKLSNGAIYFNAVISSPLADRLTITDYHRLLIDSGLINSEIVDHTFELNNVRYYYRNVQFNKYGQVSFGELYGRQKGLLKSNPDLRFYGMVSYFEDGSLKEGHPVGTIKINGHDTQFDKLNYSKGEVLLSANSISGVDINISPKDGGEPKALVKVSKVEFFESGTIRMIELSEDYREEYNRYSHVPIFIANQDTPIMTGHSSSAFLNFHRSGYIQKFETFCGTISCPMFTYQSRPGVQEVAQALGSGPVKIEIDSEGKLQKIYLPEVSLSVGKTRDAQFREQLHFYPSGVLRAGQLSRTSKFLCSDGKSWKTIKLKRDSSRHNSSELIGVQFDENGLLYCNEKQ